MTQDFHLSCRIVEIDKLNPRIVFALNFRQELINIRFDGIVQSRRRERHQSASRQGICSHVDGTLIRDGVFAAVD